MVTAYADEDWHSQRLLAAAVRRGRATVYDPSDFSVRLGGAEVRVAARGRDVRDEDVFLLARAIGERGDEDFQIETYRLMAEMGCHLVNSVDALLRAIDKFRSSILFERAGLPTPEVSVVQDARAAEAVLERLGQAVVKPLYGSLGHGVRLLEAGRAGRTALALLCRRYRALYLQRFVRGPGRDVRAFVIGDRVAAAMYRTPAPGELCANTHRGGRAEPAVLEDALASLAVRAARAVGLEYSGVDLLEGPSGPEVLEVNGAPRWEALFAATGRDMADEILDYALSRCGRAKLREPNTRREPRELFAHRNHRERALFCDPATDAGLAGPKERERWLKKARRAI